MKIIVGGSRSFEDYQLLSRKMAGFTKPLKSVEVVSGGARVGADLLGQWWAESKLYKYYVFHPDRAGGKSAVAARNQEMVDFADAAVFFWDGESPGTKDCIGRARKKGIPVRVVRF